MKILLAHSYYQQPGRRKRYSLPREGCWKITDIPYTAWKRTIKTSIPCHFQDGFPRSSGTGRCIEGCISW